MNGNGFSAAARQIVLIVVGAIITAAIVGLVALHANTQVLKQRFDDWQIRSLALEERLVVLEREVGQQERDIRLEADRSKREDELLRTLREKH